MSTAEQQQASYSIDGWCRRHSISRRTFYNLKNAGKAPRMMHVLKSIRISEAADREWIAAREADAASDKAA